MSELTVVRWRRYGKDRLYVNAADRTRVGWLDLLTGETRLEVEHLRDAFERALADHPDAPPGPVAGSLGDGWPDRGRPDPGRPAQRRPAQGRSASEEPGREPCGLKSSAAGAPWTAPPWTDVAGNRPGQSAREQAVALRRAAPIRTLVDRLLGVRTDERAWRIGADGECMIAARLATLPAPWRVLHAVPVGSRGADIDHVVIGPGGVFTVNAKHLPHAAVRVDGDAFLADGFRRPYVRNARFEAERAARLLGRACGSPVAVTGLIAVVGARGGFTVASQPAPAVHVTTQRALAGWLLRRDPVLGAERVDAVFAAARRSTTWQLSG